MALLFSTVCLSGAFNGLLTVAILVLFIVESVSQSLVIYFILIEYLMLHGLVHFSALFLAQRYLIQFSVTSHYLKMFLNGIEPAAWFP